MEFLSVRHNVIGEWISCTIQIAPATIYLVPRLQVAKQVPKQITTCTLWFVLIAAESESRALPLLGLSATEFVSALLLES